MKAEEEMKECSFKPRINKNTPHNPKFKYSSDNIFKKKEFKQAKTTDELQYDREKQECTFAPKIISNQYVA